MYAAQVEEVAEQVKAEAAPTKAEAEKEKKEEEEAKNKEGGKGQGKAKGGSGTKVRARGSLGVIDQIDGAVRSKPHGRVDLFEDPR